MADRTVKVSLIAQVEGYLKGLDQAQRKTKDMTDDAKARLEAQSKVLDTTGKAMLAFGAVAAAGVALAVKSFADWDAKMAQVQSLSHAGVKDMDSLRQATFGFAQQFGLSATQAADAEIELVKGGVSVKDMINGGLKGALTLAAAGQIDVGEATSIAVSAMTQFHLKGQDVSHVADLLAAGADKALGSVQDLGEGLKYVGPVASSMGVSIEQTVGTLAELAQAGIIGEQAGTSLRGMLQALTSPSAQAAGVMKQLGINVYDAQGHFVGLDGVAQQLKDHTKNLTEAQKNQALGQIFGNQQITAATVLMDGGAKAVDNWTKKVDENGFAAEQASGKLNSLNGDLEKLKAAFQNDLIQTGSASSGVLRTLAEGATNLLTAYGNLPQPLKDVTLGVGGLTAAVGLFGGAAILAVPKIAAFDSALATLGARPNLILGGLKSVTTFLAGPWGLGIAAGIAALVAFDKAGQASQKTIGDLTNALSSLPNDVNIFGRAFSTATNSNFIQQMTFANTQIDASTKSLKAYLAARAQASKNWLTSSATNDNQDAAVASSLKNLGKSLADLSEKSLPAAQKAWKAFADQQNLSSQDQWRALNNMGPFLDSLKDQATQLGISASKSNLLKLALGELGGAASDAASGADETVSAVTQVQDASDAAQKSVDDLVQALEGLDNGSISASEAQVAMSQAIADATAAVAQNGATLDLSTQAGRDNQRALDGIASSALALLGAQAQAGASTADLTAATQTAHDSFVQAAVAMGMSAADAENLAAKYGLIPSNVPTIIETSGAPQAVADATAVKNAIEAIPRQRIIDITTRSTLPDLNGSVSGSGRGGTFASGGPIVGPGTGTSDSIIARVSNGEFVVKASAAAKYRAQLEAINNDRVPRFANGGPIDWRYAAPAPVATSPTVSVAAPSLDGLAIAGRLEIGGDGLARIIDGRIYLAAAADARAARSGKRRY